MTKFGYTIEYMGRIYVEAKNTDDAHKKAKEDVLDFVVTKIIKKKRL